MLRTMAFAIAFSFAGAGLPVLAAAPVQASAASAASTAQQPAAVQTPVEVVKGIANQLSEALDGHRKELKGHKKKLVNIINRILLPHFDVDFAAILVLGQHARQATPEQRARFAKAFYHSLTHRYAEGLLSYTRGAVKVLPSRGPLDKRRTIVRSEVKLPNGKSVSVDYAFHKTPSGQWKAYDVIVAGISFITNYRHQVNIEIQKEGLNTLIHNLETHGGKALQQMKKDSGGAHS